jgi:hypothetical protein
MKCTIADVERFAMAASDADGKLHVVEGGVDLYAVGDALGMTRAEAQDCAEAMQLEEWAIPRYDLEPPRLIRTLKRRREIAKLRRPRWRRWINRNSAILTIAGGAIAGGAVSLAVEFFKHLLWP